MVLIFAPGSGFYGGKFKRTGFETAKIFEPKNFGAACAGNEWFRTDVTIVLELSG